MNMAKTLNSNGPGNPAGMIAELQKAMQARNTPPPPTQAPKTPVNSAADTAKKVGKLLSDAREAEKAGQAAGCAYRLRGGAQAAAGQCGSAGQHRQNPVGHQERPSGRQERAESAIHYFYASQFDDARRALLSYLESPQTARDPGAADFYLGATLIERSILQTPRTQWKGPSPEALSAFQEARKANYQPLRDYVSPAILKIWDSTNQ